MPQRSISSRRRARVGRQLLVRRRARRRDGADDAAAGGGDLGVGRAGEPPAQLVAPIAGEDHVRVRIDEAGNDRSPRGVEDERVVCQRDVASAVGVVADEHDRAAMRGDHRLRLRDRRPPGARRSAARVRRR